MQILITPEGTYLDDKLVEPESIELVVDVNDGLRIVVPMHYVVEMVKSMPDDYLASFA